MLSCLRESHFIVYKVIISIAFFHNFYWVFTQIRSLSICVEVLRPSQPNGVMSSAVARSLSKVLNWILIDTFENYFFIISVGFLHKYAAYLAL